MNEIPITFLYKGKSISGSFSKVSGAGSSAVFHLTVNGYYWGQLFYSDFGEGGWRFYSNTEPGLSDLAEEFGYVVTAFYQ